MACDVSPVAMFRNVTVSEPAEGRRKITEGLGIVQTKTLHILALNVGVLENITYF